MAREVGTILDAEILAREVILLESGSKKSVETLLGGNTQFV